MSVCSVEGCERPPGGRGLCRMHWTRWRRHGDPLQVAGVRVTGDYVHEKGAHLPETPSQSAASLDCAVDRCPYPARDDGLCRVHTARVERWGNTCPDVPTGRNVTHVRPVVAQHRGHDWRHHARCLGVDLSVFFDHDPVGALQTCARCPVLDACLDDACATGDVHAGVRGGALPSARAARARNRRSRRSA